MMNGQELGGDRRSSCAGDEWSEDGRTERE